MIDSQQHSISFSGGKIPKLGMGTWQLKNNKCSQMVAKAIDMGYRAIDTAQAYKNEESVGEGIRNSGIDRQDLFVTSKVWRENLAKKDVVETTLESLDKLNISYLDLMLIHWPNQDYDFEQTFEGFQRLKDEGCIKSFGVSNFTLEHLNTAQELAPNFVCNQVEYHPYLDQSEVLNWLRDHNKFLIAYSPLARGQVFKEDVLMKIAEKRNLEVAQVALAWLMQQDSVVAIPKASSEEHLKSNLESMNIELEDNEIDAINALQQQDRRLIDPDFAPDWDHPQPSQKQAI